MANDQVLIGLLTGPLGALSSWVASWIPYAIGEIAENTANCAYATPRNIGSTHTAEEKARFSAVFKSAASTAPSKRCPHCGESVTSKVCGMCGKENNLFK